MIEIEIKGLAAIEQALASYPAIVGPMLEETCKAALLSLVPDLKTYPPPPSGSRYRRTNNLARGWGADSEYRFDDSGPYFTAILANVLALTPSGENYGPYVQDAIEQSPYNHHWATVQDILQNNQSTLDAYFTALLQRIAARLEGQ